MKVYLAFQNHTLKPLCKNRWQILILHFHIKTAQFVQSFCVQGCLWLTLLFLIKKSYLPIWLKMKLMFESEDVLLPHSSTIQWLSQTRRAHEPIHSMGHFVAMQNFTFQKLSEGTCSCRLKTLTLYTVPKAPEPRTLTLFSSVSFRMRSCAWLGAVPLGVKGSTSYEGKSESLKYLKMLRTIRSLHWKQL